MLFGQDRGRGFDNIEDLYYINGITSGIMSLTTINHRRSTVW